MLLIIDGHSLSIRSFFASGQLEERAKDLFKSWITGLLKEFNPTHAVIAWDTPSGSLKKKELFPEYKQQRPKSVFSSEYIEGCILISQEKGFNNLKLDGFEADDIIGKLSELNMNKAIVSGDKDMIQLVSDNTYLYNPFSGIRQMVKWTPETVLKDYGFTPKQYAEYKALVGDSADNYKGVPGIGQKTATELIKTWGSIEEMYNHLDELKPSIKKKLVDGKSDCDLGLVMSIIDTSEIADIDINTLLYNNE